MMMTRDAMRRADEMGEVMAVRLLRHVRVVLRLVDIFFLLISCIL